MGVEEPKRGSVGFSHSMIPMGVEDPTLPRFGSDLISCRLNFSSGLE